MISIMARAVQHEPMLYNMVVHVVQHGSMLYSTGHVVQHGPPCCTTWAHGIHVVQHADHVVQHTEPGGIRWACRAVPVWYMYPPPRINSGSRDDLGWGYHTDSEMKALWSRDLSFRIQSGTRHVSPRHLSVSPDIVTIQRNQKASRRNSYQTGFAKPLLFHS